mmetsp:Transcript_71522/g.141833  ORF Transcript_71522/g.141833 Transcript_71522/m.141833 type:complete len:232 (-) Transcript_71522:1421-2116(-)
MKTGGPLSAAPCSMMAKKSPSSPSAKIVSPASKCRGWKCFAKVSIDASSTPLLTSSLSISWNETGCHGSASANNSSSHSSSVASAEISATVRARCAASSEPGQSVRATLGEAPARRSVQHPGRVFSFVSAALSVLAAVASTPSTPVKSSTKKRTPVSKAEPPFSSVSMRSASQAVATAFSAAFIAEPKKTKQPRLKRKCNFRKRSRNNASCSLALWCVLLQQPWTWSVTGC